MPKDSKEKIGYCNPPRSTQFKKGQSGNPKGRPKGSLNLLLSLQKALNQKVVIVQNGRRKKITKLEASVTQLVNKAAAGDLPALRQLAPLACLLGQLSPEASTSRSAMAETDQKVLQGILSRLALNCNDQGGGDGTDSE